MPQILIPLPPGVDMDMEEAWDLSQGDTSVIVAIPGHSYYPIFR